MAITKAYQLRSKSTTELNGELANLKSQLSNLRVQKVASGAANKVAQIKLVRRAIARVLTVMSHSKRDALRADCAGKLIAKDLRAKKTRAIRRRLTQHEASRETVRQHKLKLQNRTRKYALKA